MHRLRIENDDVPIYIYYEKTSLLIPVEVIPVIIHSY